MPRDFRIGYPLKQGLYFDAVRGMGLSVDLAGSITQNDENVIGDGFFEAIFAPALEKAEKDQVPLYCGEYGVIDLADSEAALRWLKDIHSAMDRHGIGRALWNYKEKDFGFSGEQFSGIRDQFIRVL